MNDCVLYAEDEDGTRTLVSARLREEGYDVVEARDGGEAIDALCRNAFALVLLDIRMPGKNGIEVLKHMKASQIRPRVIMVTAVEDLAIALEAMKLVATDYVTKPFTMETLIGCIRKVLAR